MKAKYFITLVIMLLAGFVFTSCENNRKNVADAKEDVESAKQDLRDARAEYDKEWQQFRTDSELKINVNQKGIDDFKVKLRTASSTFKNKFENEIVSLEEKNIELKERISEYNFQGKDNWEAFKREFNHDLDATEKALKDVLNQN
ncbi:MAG: hypothetical protein KKF62_09530 [Bacteroidetes bacterium]|nr:hypothetical protein [Bacteroidota bacterium]MBU1114186.1 hypothetical protein [Bacteroidota bacterium]MBU1796948.1 hypothetical protein [Bacteroidota bacterium]